MVHAAGFLEHATRRLDRATFGSFYPRAPGLVEVSVTNNNRHGVALELDVVLELTSEAAEVSEGGGGPTGGWDRGQFLGRPTVRRRRPCGRSRSSAYE